jgi:hypothetical protein
LSDLSAALGGRFVIGAQNNREGGGGFSRFVYGGSSGNLADTRLDIQFSPNALPSVPGPFPLLGATAAFGYSRKLRKRIAQSKAVPVASAID